MHGPTSRSTDTAGADANVAPFVNDALENQGYAYTTNAPLSSRLANRRLTETSLALASFRNQRVIDIGCGDGTYSRELVSLGEASVVHAVDPAEAAIRLARDRTEEPDLRYMVSSAYDLPYAGGTFDIACLRGVLHHMDRPMVALREALRVARLVLVIEPNGYNPGLKMLERCSSYHRAHGEKSYAPATLDRWVRALGGRVDRRTWVGFVAMFSPDRVALVMKRVEPVVEKVPLLRHLGCACYVFTAVPAEAPDAVGGTPQPAPTGELRSRWRRVRRRRTSRRISASSTR